MKINFTKKIKERMDNFNNDKVFISSDFLDIADYETVRKTLNRLTNSEKIKKIYTYEQKAMHKLSEKPRIWNPAGKNTYTLPSEHSLNTAN